ncbi:Site-specific recombinase XerC [Saccharopolyspora shandongensis]|uniref:Site-specific recombinase XerC n=1 Tax=Saccharopolyspora shandongensis TaxID=418495 RepID=A0A1H3DGN6_9PSEU|nr:site-specific integrase [Saccharopolyspora shandongensis]SDX65652.1 Site-specific recombinase XerC [Saccharopolyspora shandongensis]
MSKQVWAEELPSGNWSARYRHPITRRKERAGSHPSEDAALAAARKAVRELVRLYNGDPDLSPVSGAPTLAEYAAEAIDALPHVRPSTRKRYHSIARQLVKHFGDRVRVDQLDESSARSVVAAANRAGLSHSTCEGRVTVLGHIVDQAGRDGYTTVRSVDWQVPLPTEVRRQRELLDNDTVGLLTCAMPYRLWVAILVSRDTGLRISEVAGLRVQDVNLARRLLRLVGSFDPDGVWREHTKGHRAGIELPLTRRLTAALEHHIRNNVRQGQTWLFAYPDGEPVGIRNMRAAFDRARTVAGVPDAVWHDMRRTLLTTLSDEGTPLQHLQALAGHANPKTTRNYIQRVRAEDLARWTDTIDRPTTPPEPPTRHLVAV